MRQESPQPRVVQLSIDHAPGSAEQATGPLLIAAFVGVTLLALMLWVWWKRRERRVGDAPRAAFDRLCRRMQIPPGRRKRLLELAIAVNAQPVALLVSEHAESKAETSAMFSGAGQ